ncbi:GGDEF domain-containing protein, partial [Planctomycetota bacterium]
ANVFNDIVAERGNAFRYGGEEFTILIPDIDREALEVLAETIRAGVEEKDFVNEEVLPGGEVTISIGISLLPEICGEAKHFFHSADQALYLAKKLGRNRVEIAEG